jgi:hypothetical protein
MAFFRNTQAVCKDCREEDPMIRLEHDHRSIFNLMYLHWKVKHEFGLFVVERLWSDEEKRVLSRIQNIFMSLSEIVKDLLSPDA